MKRKNRKSPKKRTSYARRILTIGPSAGGFGIGSVAWHTHRFNWPASVQPFCLLGPNSDRSLQTTRAQTVISCVH